MNSYERKGKLNMSYYTEIATIITVPDGKIKELHQIYRCIVDGLVSADIESGRLPDYTEIESFMLNDKFFGESSIVYYDDCIKWNEYYLAYRAFMLFLDYVETLPGAAYHYLSFGEDYTDVESRVHGVPEEFLSLHREIRW